ncbi:2OG-Fe(II) oxygenase family protein [Phenylobacterium sp.]|jgi:predicted 2-oxoglutarate/Fe(II)-dependent dioxygenase YbiX/peroxiredoxin|uniref:2OG-Fe(II) oxygenase family protein n=1 Tax=Phenylobacterium sp. TaxID=1871053 RepID=UPI002F3FFAAF
MTHLRTGEQAPWFFAPSPTNPNFNFSTVAGRYLLMGFPPLDRAERTAVFDTVGRNMDLLSDANIACFLVIRDPEDYAKARNRDGMRFFADFEGKLAQLYGARTADGAEQPGWVVIDPSQRVLFTAPASQTAQVFEQLRALPPADGHAGVPMHAPVMIVPRVLDPDLCRRLIAHYHDQGGRPSGVMREENGRTVGVLDDFKRRRDANIEDEGLRTEMRLSIVKRLIPEIRKAYRFQVTRIERYIVACYDADEGGYFRPHRDNRTSGTEHRQFACSINLNAEAFEGGDLRFPEYGMRTYRPPTGGAVIFSCSLLHEATPVTRGTRYATLPFFFDEAGEALRLKNLHLTDFAPRIADGAPADAAATREAALEAQARREAAEAPPAQEGAPFEA